MNDELNLKLLVSKLPNNPGVYIMKNSKDEIIYIGKAKNLKNRVSSYFISDSGHSKKVIKMVENIHHFDYIVTDSEFEALVLECSLIKKYQPKYNILLKDDKGYSYIKITKEAWPKVLYVKQKENDGATYIGPYVNAFSVKQTVKEIVKIFKLPTCFRNLSKRYKRPCLNYYINRCSAPCIGAISHTRYLETIDEASKFVKNGISETLKYLKQKMTEASDNLNFEYAAELRDRIKAIDGMKNRQKVVSNKIKDQDVVAVACDDVNASFEVFRFKDGDLYESQNFITDLDGDIKNMRTEFIKRYYSLKEYIPQNIVLDGDIENFELIVKFLRQKSLKNINIIIPKIGENLKLVEMCENNAYEALLRSKENKNRCEDMLEDLKNTLSLKKIPNYIEAYDISNLKGSDNVGGMVVFKKGKPLKSAYRKFKIKTVLGQDDYSSMREIIGRRMKNYIETDKKSEEGFEMLPDLILVDGGIAHTAAVKDVLKSINIDVPVFGMVKDGKHRTRAITTDGQEIEIKSNSRIFSFITSVQDEVHRYAIGYHKKLRSKRIKTSELTKIPRVGEKRAITILKTFGSVDRVSKASSEELLLVPGITKSVANEIYNYFRKDLQS